MIITTLAIGALCWHLSHYPKMFGGLKMSEPQKPPYKYEVGQVWARFYGGYGSRYILVTIDHVTPAGWGRAKEATFDTAGNERGAKRSPALIPYTDEIRRAMRRQKQLTELTQCSSDFWGSATDPELDALIYIAHTIKERKAKK